MQELPENAGTILDHVVAPFRNIANISDTYAADDAPFVKRQRLGTPLGDFSNLVG